MNLPPSDDDAPPPTAPGMPVVPLAGIEDAAAAAYAAFIAQMAALARGPAAADSAAWRQLLETHAGQAPWQRAQFERYVAQLLADGWRPGHELLFPAAVAVFGWAGEGNGLARLGNAGLLLAQAIEAGRDFSGQGPSVRAAQYALYARLREGGNGGGAAGGEPGMHELLRLGPHLALLSGRFDALSHVITDRAALARWRQAADAAQAAAGALAAQASPARARWLRWQPVAVWVAILLGMVWLLTLAIGDDGGADNSAVVLQLAPPDEALAAIQSRIEYTRPANLHDMPLSVEFRVTLDGSRRVAEVSKVLASADPDFDDAVARAIRAAPPFPINTVPSFTVRFNYGRHAAPNSPRQIAT
jgi:protein TonB